MQPRALSTVHQETVQTYRDRYAIFGDTSGIDLELMEDVNTQEIELPRAMLMGALRSIDPITARGDVLEAYGHYKTFVASIWIGRTLRRWHRAWSSTTRTATSPRRAIVGNGKPGRTNSTNRRSSLPRRSLPGGCSLMRFVERYDGLPMVPTGNDREVGYR